MVALDDKVIVSYNMIESKLKSADAKICMIIIIHVYITPAKTLCCPEIQIKIAGSNEQPGNYNCPVLVITGRRKERR